MKYAFIILFLTSISLLSCKTKEQSRTDEGISVAKETQQLKENLTLEGTIKKQGITTYQYGSHVLNTETAFYALRSESVDLDIYANQKVKIKAEKIEGYPVSGGPDYLLVKSVEPIK